MDSGSDSSYEEVDFEKYRREYESQEHWIMRKVKLVKFNKFSSEVSVFP
jgi:hypothetical protein